MTPEDDALFQQAKEWYNSGKQQKAYKQFCEIYPNNKEDTSLLCWLGYSTPNLDEAQRALADVERLKPNHPSLPKLRDRVNTMRPPVQPRPQYVASSRIVMTCPFCGYEGPDRIKSKVSTGGWITLVVLLFLFFPICWIGLLIRKDYSVCGRCGIALGDIAY